MSARHRLLPVLLLGGALGTSAGRSHAAEATPVSEGPPVIVSPRLLLQTDAVLARQGTAAPLLEDAATRPGLYLRRARVGVDAVSGIWRGRLMIEAAGQAELADNEVGGAATGPGALARPPLYSDAIAGEVAGGAPRATEAYLALAPHKAFALRVGSMRVPIGLSRQIDEGDLRLPERARVIARVAPDYRVGVAAGGDLGLLQYAFGTYSAAARFGAAGSSFSEGGALYVLRLSGEPIGPVGVAPQLRRRDDPWTDWARFSVGVSVFQARLPGDNEWGLGGDAQFQWRRLCMTGEVLWTRRSTADRVGFTVEPGLFLIPDRLELVTRLEWFNDQVGPPSPADAWGASLGATVLTRGRHVRGQIVYTWRHPLAAGASDVGWALVRATFTL